MIVSVTVAHPLPGEPLLTGQAFKCSSLIFGTWRGHSSISMVLKEPLPPEPKPDFKDPHRRHLKVEQPNGAPYYFMTLSLEYFDVNVREEDDDR